MPTSNDSTATTSTETHNRVSFLLKAPCTREMKPIAVILF